MARATRRTLLLPLQAGLAGVERLRSGWIRRQNDLKLAIALELQLKPRADDVFVVCYPRSGGTLLQMMLLELTGRGGLDFVHVASRSPLLDFELVRGNARFLEGLPAPRILRSFRRREELPRRGRFIYLARDLYDVAVSAYHHTSLLVGHDPELEDFVRRFPRGHVSLSCSWFDHLRSWWPHRDAPDVLFLDYAEVVADLDGAIRRVADFCGIAIDESRLPLIREHCGIGFMKRHAEKFDPRLRRIDEQEVAFIRGARGAARPALPPEQHRLITARVQAFARRLGVRPGEPLAALFRGEPDAG